MVDPVYRKIGAIVRQKRKQLMMKQEILAKRLAISRGSLANIEIGRQSILVHQLYRFARELDLAPNDLLPPVESSSSLNDWTEVLPKGLNPLQQKQIVRLLDEAQPEHSVQNREKHAKLAKQ